MNGVVVAFDAAAGLGTIAADDGEHYPFHCVEISDGTRTIEVGVWVEFTTLAKLGRHEASAIAPT